MYTDNNNYETSELFNQALLDLACAAKINSDLQKENEYLKNELRKEKERNVTKENKK